MSTATTRLIVHHISKGETVAQSLKDRFDYGQNPDKTQGGELIFSYKCDYMTAYAEQHPDVCRQTDADPKIGCMEFDIEKGRFSFRLTAPYSEERREAARRYARENNAADSLK